MIACYYGECCASAHLLAARVTAENPKAAEEQLARHIREVEGNDPGEVVAFLGPGDTPTLEEVKEDFIEASGD